MGQYTPDGTQLVFASTIAGNGVYVINLDGTGLRKVVATETYYYYALVAPTWAPGKVPGAGNDQVRIAYVDETAPGQTDIYLVNVDGTGKTRLTTTTNVEEFHPTWSPSATQLAAQVGDGYVAVYDFTTDIYRLVALRGPLAGAGCFHPTWAKADESKLAMVATPAAAGGIWVVDLDDLDNPAPLTRGEEVRAPSWSPDDARIVFMSASSNGRRLRDHAIEVMDADGSNRAKIMSGAVAPSWRR